MSFRIPVPDDYWTLRAFFGNIGDSGFLLMLTQFSNGIGHEVNGAEVEFPREDDADQLPLNSGTRVWVLNESIDIPREVFLQSLRTVCDDYLSRHTEDAVAVNKMYDQTESILTNVATKQVRRA